MIYRSWGETAVNLADPWTLFGRDSRIVPLFNQILSSSELMSAQGGVPSVAENVFGALILFSQEGSEPVKIVINSPGGTVQAGFTIIQGMNHLKAKGIEVWTINLGNAGSMAGIILALGTPGRRYVLNETTSHAHEIHIEGPKGRRTDFAEAQRHLQHMHEVMEKLLAQQTKIPEYYLKLVEMDREIDSLKLENLEFRQKMVGEFLKQERLLNVNEAVEAGMADEIIMPGDSVLDEIFARFVKKDSQ